MKTSSNIPWYLQKIRGALRRMNSYLSRRYEQIEAQAHPAAIQAPPARMQEAERCLRLLKVNDGVDRVYFEKHLTRLARTLTMVPQSNNGGAVLELGCYGQITPFLRDFCGYSVVRGAHYGPAGTTQEKYIEVLGQYAQVKVDLFDAERDPFPYKDSSFEAVLVCEVIEHLLHDPIGLLLECRRVLAEGGKILVTTPNISSLTSVARVLHGHDNPQIYSHYSIPTPESNEIPHVREYTVFEVRNALVAAGFEIETLITEPIAEWSKNLAMRNFLEDQGYDASLRGEQIYCVGVKRGQLPVERFPAFLYN